MNRFISRGPPKCRNHVRCCSCYRLEQPASKWKLKKRCDARTTTGIWVFRDAGRAEAQARQSPIRSQATQTEPMRVGGSAEFLRRAFAHVQQAPPVETRGEAVAVVRRLSSLPAWGLLEITNRRRRE